MDSSVYARPQVIALLDYTLAFKHEQQHVWSQYHKSFYEYECHMIDTINGVNPEYLTEFVQTELWLYQKEQKDLEATRKLYREVAAKKFYCFLTINYDDTTGININIMHKIAQQVCGQKNVQSAIYVHEKFRKEQGIHHHTHFLITTAKYVGAGDMIDPIFKIAAVKQYVGSRNFIDCQVAHSRKGAAHSYDDYLKYLSGDKKEEKMPYVLKDRAWRELTGYEHQYQYTK